jgi:hypothetical protein
MLQVPLSSLPTLPSRLRRGKRFTPCKVAVNDEYYANGIFEFNISRILEFLDADSARYPVERLAVASIPEYGGAPLDEATVCKADLSRPVLLAEISPGRFNLIDGNHRMAKARRQGVLSLPARRMRCPEHLKFLTSVFAYESYVEYWNGKVKEMGRRRLRVPAV